jgi:hypothetical protein
MAARSWVSMRSVESLAASAIKFPVWTRDDGVNMEGSGIVDISTSDADVKKQTLVSPKIRPLTHLAVIGKVRPRADVYPTVRLSSFFSAIFVRSLRELWARTQNKNLQQLIEAYILVQHNALLDLATVPGKNTYSSSWIGPPVSELLPWGQVAALDVLNSAFSIAPPGNRYVCNDA